MQAHPPCGWHGDMASICQPVRALQGRAAGQSKRRREAHVDKDQVARQQHPLCTFILAPFANLISRMRGSLTIDQPGKAAHMLLLVSLCGEWLLTCNSRHMKHLRQGVAICVRVHRGTRSKL